MTGTITQDLARALREIADDYSGRFDMDSPSTNPGMKYVVKQAREALARFEASKADSGVTAEVVERALTAYWCVDTKDHFVPHASRMSMRAALESVWPSQAPAAQWMPIDALEDDVPVLAVKLDLYGFPYYETIDVVQDDKMRSPEHWKARGFSHYMPLPAPPAAAPPVAEEKK